MKTKWNRSREGIWTLEGSPGTTIEWDKGAYKTVSRGITREFTRLPDAMAWCENR
jgi:hypothetical protein